MSNEITPELVTAARNQGFVNHCTQQGLSEENTGTLLDNVYTPLADQREQSLVDIAQTVVSTGN